MLRPDPTHCVEIYLSPQTAPEKNTIDRFQENMPSTENGMSVSIFKRKATACFLTLAGVLIFFAFASNAADILRWIRPLPFSGPYQGLVLDDVSGQPIPYATIEAVWWCHDSFWPDVPGSFYLRAYGISDKAGQFQMNPPQKRSGWFGENFHLAVSARGYRPLFLFVDPEQRPLPPATVAWPFRTSLAVKEMARSMTFRLSPFLPILRDTLGARDPAHRSQAAEQLGLLGLDAAAAAPDLIKTLKDPKQRVRAAAAEALGQIAAPEPQILPHLLGMLDDPDSDVRCAVMTALGRFGPGASPAIPLLIEALKADDQKIGTAARDALSRIGPPAATALKAELESGNLEKGVLIREAFLMVQFEADHPQNRRRVYQPS